MGSAEAPIAAPIQLVRSTAARIAARATARGGRSGGGTRSIQAVWSRGRRPAGHGHSGLAPRLALPIARRPLPAGTVWRPRWRGEAGGETMRGPWVAVVL